MGEAATVNSTRERLLEVAEGLFAESGFDQVSVRDITQAAGANVAAVNYHFGSRNGLVDAVVERFVLPVEAARLRALEAVEQSGEPSLEAIMEAYLKPVLDRVSESELSEQLFFKLIARCTTQQGDFFPLRVQRTIEEVLRRFTGAVHAELPELPIESILWRLQFTWGALVQSLSQVKVFEMITKGEAGALDSDALSQELVQFSSAGMRAETSKNFKLNL
jgi:AcrR family transcriptional regulator